MSPILIKHRNQSNQTKPSLIKIFPRLPHILTFFVCILFNVVRIFPSKLHKPTWKWFKVSNYVLRLLTTNSPCPYAASYSPGATTYFLLLTIFFLKKFISTTQNNMLVQISPSLTIESSFRLVPVSILLSEPFLPFWH